MAEKWVFNGAMRVATIAGFFKNLRIASQIFISIQCFCRRVGWGLKIREIGLKGGLGEAEKDMSSCLVIFSTLGYPSLFF